MIRSMPPALFVFFTKSHSPTPKPTLAASILWTYSDLLHACPFVFFNAHAEAYASCFHPLDLLFLQQHNPPTVPTQSHSYA